MTWLLPTLVVATLGGAEPSISAQAPMMMAPIVLAQDSVPVKGGGGGAAEQGAPAATAEGGAQGGQAAAPEGGGWQMLLIMGLIFGFFWLFFIRPQNKQMKEHQALIEGLKKGDAVVTQGGIYGRISGFDDETNTVILEIATNTRVKVVRSQIAKLQGSEKPAETKDGALKTKAAKGK